MKYFYFLLLFISVSGTAQESWDDFTGKQKAFFYHQARRVEILNSEIFHLFEFTDSIPYINDTLPDYSYVEKQIVQHPSLLLFHADQMKRKSEGILSDLTVRFALWELSQILQYRNSTAEEDKPLLERLKTFEKYVLEEVPQSAIRTLNNGDYVLVKTVQGYYAPSLSIADKMAAILNAGYEQLDQMLILNAIMSAQEKYVSVRSREIYKALGGTMNLDTKDFLSAVGDGGNWAEIVGGFNTPYTVGLPDEIGLFKFNIEEKLDKEKEKTFLKVKAIERTQFKTDENHETVVHIDVFGYHPERQTTIAIQKGGKSYVLYGKNEHRLVSPDSTYGEGTTYWRLMYDLEINHIEKIKEDLYGKHGYEYQIDRFENLIEKTKMQIKQTEYRLDKLRHTPEGPPKIKKKKIKKKDLGRSDQDGRGHPTSALSKLDKKKNIEQARLVQLNNLLDGQKATLKQLKEDMEQAYINLVKYEAMLDIMKKNIGYTIMEFEQNNHLFTFKDGATFNYLTQEFVFPADRSESVFQIYHISFGEKLFDKQIDENFAHINVSTRYIDEDYTLKRTVRDNARKNITVSDSIQIMELFRHLAKKEIKSTFTVNAGGIVGESENNIFRDSTNRPETYNAEAETNNGVIVYDAILNQEMNLSLTVFEDDMIPKDFENYRAAYNKLKQKNPQINEIDFYTGIRAKKAAENWIKLLQELAPTWIKDNADQKRVLSKLKKMKAKKIYFLNGTVAAKVPAIVK